jgi:hypothetical protein
LRPKREASPSAASGTRPPSCQKWGSSSRAVGPRAEESTAATRSARIGRALDEDVRDGEGVVQGERGVVAAGADLLGPDLGRDVEQQTAAVALPVDVAGPVEHLLQRLERQDDRLVARGCVAPHRGVDRAGVLVLDARGRDARAIGALR